MSFLASKTPRIKVLGTKPFDKKVFLANVKKARDISNSLRSIYKHYNLVIDKDAIANIMTIIVKDWD
jgi:hypothetical protein